MRVKNFDSLVISAREYTSEHFLDDIEWSREEDTERQRWHEARHREMTEERIVSWRGMNFLVKKGVFSPYLDSYPLADQLEQTVENGMHVLDIGGGAGNLAVHVAKRNPNGFVTSIDINPAAVETIIVNAGNYNVGSIVRARQSDMFANEHIRLNKPYDLIINNLPFVEGKAQTFVERSTRDPNLRSYKALFQDVHMYLREGGAIYLAYANFAPIKKLLSIANEHGYNSDLMGALRMNSIQDEKQRLGLVGEYNIFSDREKDKRVFYALVFTRK